MKYLSLIALILVVLACGTTEKSDKPSNQVPASTPSTPIPITASVLTREYKENELAADEKYKNKVLEVSGKISNISEVMGNISVDLEGHKENNITLLSVQCSFPQSEKASLAKLKSGQNVTFQGTNEGMTLNLFVSLKDCRLTKIL